MGGLAGAARRGGPGPAHLTRWALAVADLSACATEPLALVLAPDAVVALPPVPDEQSDTRGRARARVLAALAQAIGVGAGLSARADGVRRLTGTRLFASVAERHGWAAAAVASRPVGVDIESRAEAEAAAATVFAGVEADDLAAWHGPAGVWAAREAVLKAVGRDLTRDPGQWHLAAGVAAAPGLSPHRVDLLPLSGVVAAIAYVGA